jgi:peptidyl-prolyl cis-trans isomerase SurA
LAQGLRPSTGAGSLGLPRSNAAGTLQPSAITVPRVSGSVTSESQQADYIVAVVNSEPITNNEVRQRAERAAQQFTQQGRPLPPRDQFMRQVLERMINEKAQLQVAKENGIKVDESSVDQAEQSVARQNQVEVPEMRRRLQADGIALSRFRDDLRNQLLLLRLREREVESRVKISDLEVDQYIQDQQGKSDTTALELNLGHVLIIVPEMATPQEVATLQQKAQRAADRARAGEDFATVAREMSDASEGRNGGLLGLRGADRYPSLFVDAVKNQPVGSIVGPIRSPAGFHVLKVVEKVQGGVGTSVIQTHARHILLRTGPQLTEAQAIERLADYRRRVQTGQATFESLAREYSVDGSAKDGGDLGWANPGQFVPEFEEALAGLTPNDISEPVVSRFGVHLIQLVERRSHTLTQREQRDMARNDAREKKLDEAYSTWAQEVRGRAYVEFRDPPQ